MVFFVFFLSSFFFLQHHQHIYIEGVKNGNIIHDTYINKKCKQMKNVNIGSEEYQ